MLGVLMLTSSIKSLIVGSLDPEDFVNLISDELSQYQLGLQKAGGSTPIYVSVDTEIYIDKNAVKKLCQLFIFGALDQNTLAYIADAIELSDGIECANDFVRDIVFEMTDPEVNGLFTIQRAREITSEINA
jgi:hypothetical protein